MLSSAFRLCASALLAISDLAQQAPPPDPATVLDKLDKQIEPLASAWLGSPDPRVEAWGAYVVLRDRRTEAIPDLLAMLARFPIVEEIATQADKDQHDAMLGVLDALIQFDAPVPAIDAQRVYPEFPVQSLILLSRSQEDTTPALLTIFQSERRWPAAWLAAGNLLAERRAGGFAAAVVEGMTVHALVQVTEGGSGGGAGGGLLCCGLAGLAMPRAGWPPLGAYAFGGCGDRVQPGATVLAVGTDPAYYHRQVNSSYHVNNPFPCACRPDQDLVRQHYLTTLLRNSADQPPVLAHVARTIEWQGPDAYLGELAAFIREQQDVFSELARRLAGQSLLSEEEAKTIRPRLQIRIWDLRTSHQPALPTLANLPGNTTVEPF